MDPCVRITLAVLLAWLLALLFWPVATTWLLAFMLLALGAFGAFLAVVLARRFLATNHRQLESVGGGVITTSAIVRECVIAAAWWIFPFGVLAAILSVINGIVMLHLEALLEYAMRSVSGVPAGSAAKIVAGEAWSVQRLVFRWIAPDFLECATLASEAQPGVARRTAMFALGVVNVAFLLERVASNLILVWIAVRGGAMMLSRRLMASRPGGAFPCTFRPEPGA